MHLTREALDVWAESLRLIASDRRRYVWLEEGDSMDPDFGLKPTIGGPAIVELVVWRDGGWSAREMTYETPESIALAASLTQREQTYLWQSQTLPVPPERRQ